MPKVYSNIRELLEDVKSGTLMLPMIQRPFVWRNEERLERLFDSIIAGYPIGIVLLYKKSPAEKMKIYGRKFFLSKIDDSALEKSYDFSEAITDKQYLVLDGQQRLQSLYLGYYGHTFLGKRLYYNLLFDSTERMKGTSAFEFKKDSSNDAIIEDGNQELNLFVLYSKVIEFAEMLIGIGDDLDEKEAVKSQFFDFLVTNGVDKNTINEQIDKIFRRLEHVNDTIFFKENPRLFSTLIIENKKFGDVLEIFVRFNQGGLTLSRSDLIFSTLHLSWKEAGQEMTFLSDKTGINKDMLLKALIVSSGFPAQTQIYEIKDKVEILKDNFPQFRETVQKFHDRVKQVTQVTSRLYGKFNFMIPLIYYFSKRPNELDRHRLSEMVIKYMLIIYFNSNLRSNNHLNSITSIIDGELVKSDSFPLNKIIDYLRGRVKTEIDQDSLNADPILTFSLIQRQDWAPLSYRNRLHIDHIFPQSKHELLPEQQRALVDSIWNKYIVFAGDNIRKSDELPEKYFSNKHDLLETYILDKALLSKAKFSELMEYRKSKIKDAFLTNLKIKIDA